MNLFYTTPMRLILNSTLALMLVAGLAYTQDKGKGGAPKAAPVPGMAISSPDFEDGGVIPDKFTQAVQNAPSPKLDWKQVPAGTQSFTQIGRAHV